MQNRELTVQQKEAVEKLRTLRVGALFMACGTGKTQTAVALINGIDDADLLVWLCPCQTKDNLCHELTECGFEVLDQQEIYYVPDGEDDETSFKLGQKLVEEAKKLEL